METWQDILLQMRPISLDEMSAIKLMNRIDTKYIANIDFLPQILQQAKERGYYAQEIDHMRVAEYDTLYFDTTNLDMFVMHHNRHLRRQKIRIRKYIGSDLTFLEVKNKTNTGRTKKKRRQIFEGDFPTNLTADLASMPDVQQFILDKSVFDVDTLQPQLSTRFKRITLVNSGHTERLTIDLSLQWENKQTGRTKCFEKLMVIELKQDGLVGSEMKNILLDMHIHPCKMSKYCIGVTLTNPVAKHNRFKQKIRKIRKITNN